MGQFHEMTMNLIMFSAIKLLKLLLHLQVADKWTLLSTVSPLYFFVDVKLAMYDWS